MPNTSLPYARAVLLLLVGLVAVACRKNNPPPGETPTEARRTLLVAIAECSTKQYSELSKRSAALASETSQWSNSGADAGLANARKAWVDTMTTWEETESFVFGPLAMSSTPGGKELRASIYAWPLASRCAVEEALVAKTYAGPAFSATALANARGLATLEYLFFYDGKENACPVDNAINTTGSWAALTDAERLDRRRVYAKVVADDLAAKSREVLSLWNAGFKDDFVTAGRGSAVYSSDRMALNAVSDPIVTLGLDLKNMKLGKPFGFVSCPSGDCKDSLESPFARVSRDHVKNNLVGMQKILAGCAGLGQGRGFDDLLISNDATDFASRMTKNLQFAIDKVSAIPDNSMLDSIAAKSSALREAYEAVRTVEIDLKTEFISLLDLELPKRVEGDND